MTHITVKEQKMNGRTVWAVIACAFVICAGGSPTTAQNIDAKEYWLDNGMQVLMVERHEAPTIMASIFARVGSSNEKTGITGISHLFEKSWRSSILSGSCCVPRKGSCANNCAGGKSGV
jgi:hypothetical protein